MSAIATNRKATFENLMQPWSVGIDVITGVMDEPDRTLVRRASDMKGYYKDQAALQKLVAAGDPVHYEVFEKTIPEEYGHLLLCISKLYPGTVGDECFMTKGHYHTVAGTGEVYLCLRGEGYMVMKTEDGRTNEQKFAPNRMVYVPPFWAHRSVNTGDEPLISFCVYPADAGHNYGDIEKQGFPQKITRRDGRVEIR